MPHLFDAAGLKRSSTQATDPVLRTLSRLRTSRTSGTTGPRSIEELQKFLAGKGLASLPTPTGLSTNPTVPNNRNVRGRDPTTTGDRPAVSPGEGGARPTTSLTRAGVPTSQLGTLFGSPLNIPARIGQALGGRQLTGGLFDIINTGRAAGIKFPSATIFRRLSPSERRAAQDAARLKGISGEEFQAGILRSSPGDRPRPSIRSRSRRSRVAV